MTDPAPNHGRPRVHKEFRRIEQARQRLVNAEEAYLRKNQWSHTQVGESWFWQLEVGGVRLVLERGQAVKFQRSAEEKHG